MATQSLRVLAEKCEILQEEMAEVLSEIHQESLVQIGNGRSKGHDFCPDSVNLNKNPTALYLALSSRNIFNF